MYCVILTYPSDSIFKLQGLFIEGRNSEKHKETLESLESIGKIPIPLPRLNHLMKRQLWRLQDLPDGSGLGFTMEFFFLALKQLSSSSSPKDLKRVVYIGTFKAIPSGWEDIKDPFRTQRVLLNLICDLIIPHRGIFSVTFPTLRHRGRAAGICR